MPPSAEPPAGDLFLEVLGAPDRDHVPGEPPVLSYRDNDEPAYLDAIERRARRRVTLDRRGIFHGHIAEIEGEELVTATGRPPEATRSERWHTAKPIVLRGLADPGPAFAGEIAERRRLHDELKESGGLRRFLKRHKPELEPAYQVNPRPARLLDADRDIERVTITWKRDPDDPSSPNVRDLWAKSAWLSTSDEDESLRMRLSFGSEVDDDASRDVRRHRRVTDLAEILLPECALAHANATLVATIDGLCGARTFFTQHIAYWNAPGGGALFHHDAFAEDSVGGQRGVCYVQLSGSTAWLALSIEDLARRVIEFGEYLAEGELSWVREQAFRAPDSFERFLKMTERFMRVVRELSRPGCGKLGRIVNRGPEFTSFLADAGHATILGPGDVLLLPNHGYRRTAMHSVFAASDEPAYSLSMAIREIDPPPPVHAEESAREHARSHPRSGRARGRSRSRRRGDSGRAGNRHDR